MVKLRALLLRWRLPRCIVCRTLLERGERFCSDTCERQAAEMQTFSA